MDQDIRYILIVVGISILIGAWSIWMYHG